MKNALESFLNENIGTAAPEEGDSYEDLMEDKEEGASEDPRVAEIQSALATATPEQIDKIYSILFPDKGVEEAVKKPTNTPIASSLKGA